MQYILEGLLFGLFLSLSMGPIFVALTLTSIEKGLKPGMTVGLGVWCSDIAIVGLLFLFIKTINVTVNSTSFKIWVGIIGGAVLILYGIKLFLHKGDLNFNKKALTAKNYLGFWIKGFLVNTLNPFTPIFWVGVITTYVIANGTNQKNTILFLSAIIFMIVFSDSVKIILASFIRKKLTNDHFRKITSFSGLIMVFLGVYIAVKEFIF